MCPIRDFCLSHACEQIIHTLANQQTLPLVKQTNLFPVAFSLGKLSRVHRILKVTLSLTQIRCSLLLLLLFFLNIITQGCNLHYVLSLQTIVGYFLHERNRLWSARPSPIRARQEGREREFSLFQGSPVRRARSGPG